MSGERERGREGKKERGREDEDDEEEDDEEEERNMGRLVNVPAMFL